MADIITQDASMAAKQAQDTELVALKQQMDRLKGDLTPGPNGKQKLRKACTDFEAVFISKMWEQMRATIPKGGMLHSPQEDMYRSMFDRDFSEKMASNGGFGLGDMMYNQLKDKIKDTRKTLGQLGSESLRTDVAAQAATAAGAASDASASAAASTAAAAATRPTGKMTQSATGKLSRNAEDKTTATNTSASGLFDKPTLKMPKRPLASATQQTTGAATAASSQPASVPGEVMADVEALARRIESDYDRRQAKAVLQSGQVSGASQPGSATSTRGLVNAYGQSGSQGFGSTGRRIATIG